MRKVLALVAVAACDGGANNLMIDAGLTQIDATVMPDAEEGIDGMWRDTFHAAGGETTVSACTNVAPSALVVDTASALTTPYAGACKTDGAFRIVAPGNIGSYYLRIGTSLYQTDKRAGIDLSSDRLGRPSSDILGAVGVTLDLNLTDAQPWTTSDRLYLFSGNIGYRQVLSLPTTAGATTIAGTASWNGYKIDSSKLDTLQILQLGQHTTQSGLAYESLDRIFPAAPFTMTNNTAVDLDGAFVAPTAASMTLTVGVASFHAFTSVVAPSVTTKPIQGGLHAAVSTDTVDSPPLLGFAQNADGYTLLSYGSLPYGDPFEATWQRLFKLNVGFTVPYSYNGYNGTRVASMERVVTRATANGNMVNATLGPPANVKFDNDDALTDTTISPVPMLSWSPPTLGTATDYEIQVYEAKSSGASTLSFQPILRIVTKETSVRIPAGFLLGQRQYVFSIKARNRTGVDIATTPLRAGTEWSSAEMLTALVTTDL